MKTSRPRFSTAILTLISLNLAFPITACATSYRNINSLETSPLIRHIVAFKFAARVSENEKINVVNQFLALKKQIPTIFSLEAGLNNSTEGLDKGFTHIFIVTFRSLKDRDDYVYRNRAHEKFKTLVGPLLDGGSHGVVVLDFNVRQVF